MADQGYVHGILVKEGSGEVQIVRSPGQSIVGIVGTAPQSTTLKDNIPAAFLGRKAALAAIYPDGAKGDKGSLYDAVIGVQDQTPARMILIKAKSSGDADILSAIDTLADAESVTGFKPKILIASGFGSSNPAAPTSQPRSVLAEGSAKETNSQPKAVLVTNTVATIGETKNG